jgi:hypothetical protein
MDTWSPKLIWHGMKHIIIIQYFFIFFSLDHGIINHFLSWHVVTKLHVMIIFFKLKFSDLSIERFCHHLPWCIYDCILHLFKIPLCTHPSRFEPKTSRKCTKVLTTVGWVSQFYVTHWVQFSQSNLQKGPVFPKLKK